MAEAFLRQTAGETIEVASAGSAPSGHVHPLAVRAMAEVDLRLETARSKSIDEFQSRSIETLITVCANAGSACHTFPTHGRHHHWEFPDPALAQGSEAQRMAIFRDVRDAIEQAFTAYGQERLEGARSGMVNQVTPGKD